MNKSIAYFFSTALVAGSFMACSVPKKVQEKTYTDYPKTFNFKDSTQAHATPLTVDKFFQDPHMKNLIEKAIRYNYALQSSAQREQIAMAYYQQSRGTLLPTLMAEIFASGQRYGKYTIDGVGNFDTNKSPNIEEGQKINTDFSPNYLLGLNVHWEIDLWGRLASMKRASMHQFLATQAGEQLLRAAIITQVAAYYYDLIALDKELEILQSNLALQEKAYTIVQIQKQAGRATELAVQQFKAQISKTKALTHKIIHDIEERENSLLHLIGEYDGEITRSADFNTHGLSYVIQHGNPQSLIEYRPDIQQQYQVLQSNYQLAQSARAAFFPKLSLGSSVGFNAFNAEFLFNPASAVYSLLGNLSAPIFQQHQLKSQFKIANAEHELAFLAYQQSINKAYNEVKTISHFLHQNEQIKHHNKAVVEALERSIEIANNLYTTGYASYLEVITAQKDKLESDLNLLQSEYKEVLALIQLYKSLGGGWQ